MMYMYPYFELQFHGAPFDLSAHVSKEAGSLLLQRVVQVQDSLFLALK